jgi:hypothetical protein
MASFTITGAPWVTGTPVGVYLERAWLNPPYAPSGTPIATGIVSTAATVTFSGLAEQDRYVAWAFGTGVRFATSTAGLIVPGDRPDRERLSILEAQAPADPGGGGPAAGGGVVITADTAADPNPALYAGGTLWLTLATPVHVIDTSGRPGPGTVAWRGSTPTLTAGTAPLNHFAPTAATTMTNTVSHLGGFADTTNTGRKSTTTLYRVPEDITVPRPDGTTGSGWVFEQIGPNGWIKFDTAGGTVKNVATSVVQVTANNVTVEQCVISNGGENAYGVEIRHASNVIVQDNTIHGPVQFGPERGDNGIRDIYGDSQNLTLRRNNIYWFSSGINNIWNGGLIEQNYIHDMGWDDTTGADHTNGLQFAMGTGPQMIVRNNTILNDRNQTDAIMLSNDAGAEDNRYIDHNLIGGGGYPFYGAGSLGSPATRITFINNRFSRIYYPTSGSIGYVANWNPHPSNVWNSNVWDEDNATVLPP